MQGGEKKPCHEIRKKGRSIKRKKARKEQREKIVRSCVTTGLDEFAKGKEDCDQGDRGVKENESQEKKENHD